MAEWMRSLILCGCVAAIQAFEICGHMSTESRPGVVFDGCCLRRPNSWAFWCVGWRVFCLVVLSCLATSRVASFVCRVVGIGGVDLAGVRLCGVCV